MSNAPTRVMLVDDQQLLRMGLRIVVDSEPDLRVVAEASDGDDALAQAQATRPDVILMDIRMPGTDGISATARIAAQRPDTRIIILTTFNIDRYVFDALQAGASGFLLKDADPDTLLGAIRTVAQGEAVLAPAATRKLITRFVDEQPMPEAQLNRLDPLTEREREVFALLTQGRSNREIADGLFLSENTVKIHVGRVLTKLGLRDRVQAVVFAYESGLVQSGRGIAGQPIIPDDLGSASA